MEHILLRVIEVAFGLSLFMNALLFLPQAYVLYQRKESSEISLLTFIGFLTMQVLTILHGLIIHDYILVFGFALSLITCAIVTYLTVYYRVYHV